MNCKNMWIRSAALLVFAGVFEGCSSDGHDGSLTGEPSGGAASVSTGGTGSDPQTTGGSWGSGTSSAPAAGGTTASGGGSGAGDGTGGVVELPGLYVAPDGDDANPGTMDAPFATLDRAREEVRKKNDEMTDDLHVYLRAGTYRLSETVTFTAEDSGENGHRIYYEAYPGETPVLSGAVPVTGWEVHQDNIYKAQLERSSKLRNLYVGDRRALMASKRIPSQGGTGTFSVTAGQADWAWSSGSASDGIKYSTNDLPEISANRDDLEIVNGTTWNENIVCTRDVVTQNGARVLLLQQPYGAIAQLPGWNAGFSTGGTHTVFNAFEFLNEPGTFYFDKSKNTLFYIPRSDEDMSSIEVEAPMVETLIDLHGTSREEHIKNITFRGITFAHTDYNLKKVGDSRGKATVQGATTYVAFGDGNWHNSQYEIIDTLPAAIMISSADSIEMIGNRIKHIGSEGISMVNDVVETSVIGNSISDIAGSGITIGHPQHVYLGDGGTHARYDAAEEGVCTDVVIKNNLLYDISSLRGFGGHSGITAFFVDGLIVEHNHIQHTAYNGISLGWGWVNFQDSTTCRDNSVSYNRFVDTLSRLHDSGAVYTIGQMPGTQINENYVQGIPPATSGPTYGLHNDEGTAFIVENDNVLDIDPGVKYTINCEDFGGKHDLVILRTYATVNKMGINPPSSMIDPPIVVSDNVWPLEQYTTCVNSGIENSYQDIVPMSLASMVDQAFPASVAASAGSEIPIRPTGEDTTVWFAPSGTDQFVEGDEMTRASGTAEAIEAPAKPGTYKLFVVDAQGQKQGESEMILRVGN